MIDKVIEGIGVIAKLNDGKHYQMILSNENSKKVLELINQLENGLKIKDRPLEELKFEEYD